MIVGCVKLDKPLDPVVLFNETAYLTSYMFHGICVCNLVFEAPSQLYEPYLTNFTIIIHVHVNYLCIFLENYTIIMSLWLSYPILSYIPLYNI